MKKHLTLSFAVAAVLLLSLSASAAAGLVAPCNASHGVKVANGPFLPPNPWDGVKA